MTTANASTNDLAPAVQLSRAIEAAKRSWTGIDWSCDDTDICTVADVLEDGKSPMDCMEDGQRITSWMAHAGQERGQRHHRECQRVLVLWEDGDEDGAKELARVLADEAIAYVESRADQASEHGARADAADNWDDAVAELQQACAIEREFGDCPTWRPVLALAEAAAKGAADGASAVDAALEEQGRDAVVATLEPGSVSWDTAAIDAFAAAHRDVAEAHRGVYYAAYARAARERAEEIAAEEYAAIGTDGARPVVWGLGSTPELAEREARDEASQSDVDADLLRTVPVTVEQAARIRAGEVSAESLGLAHPKQVAGVAYRIEVRDEKGRWDAGGVGEPNRFDSEQEAEEAIASLRTVGFDDCEMRVSAI